MISQLTQDASRYCVYWDYDGETWSNEVIIILTIIQNKFLSSRDVIGWEMVPASWRQCADAIIWQTLESCSTSPELWMTGTRLSCRSSTISPWSSCLSPPSLPASPSSSCNCQSEWSELFPVLKHHFLQASNKSSYFNCQEQSSEHDWNVSSLLGWFWQKDF